MRYSARFSVLTVPLAAGLLALSGCGYSVFDAAEDVSSFTADGLKNGQPIGETPVALSAFDELAVIGPDAVIFTTEGTHSIRAAGSSDLLSHLRYSMEDGTLLIGRDRNYSGDGGSATIYVTGASLKAVSAAGSGAVTVDRMAGPSVDLSMAGSGGLKVMDVQTDRLDASMAGSGNMQLAGRAAASDISIAGSGDIDGQQLTTDRADVSIAGSGGVKLRSDGTVEASIMGSGDVDVTGSATCETSAMGSGKARCGR